MPKKTINNRVPENPSKVFRKKLLLNPKKENKPAKKLNNFNSITNVIIRGINNIRPCKKYPKNFFI